MPISFMATALLGVSLLTNLTVESFKKLLNKTDANYSSNAIAAIVSVILAGVGCGIYMITVGLDFTPKIGVEIAVLMYLSFLVSTVGYDKVVQMIMQINSTKEDKPNE